MYQFKGKINKWTSLHFAFLIMHKKDNKISCNIKCTCVRNPQGKVFICEMIICGNCSKCVVCWLRWADGIISSQTTSSTCRAAARTYSPLEFLCPPGFWIYDPLAMKTFLVWSTSSSRLIREAFTSSRYDDGWENIEFIRRAGVPLPLSDR